MMEHKDFIINLGLVMGPLLIDSTKNCGEPLRALGTNARMM